MQNAKYAEEPFEVVHHVYGIGFDIEYAKGRIAEYQNEYVIPLTITPPEVRIESLGMGAFPDLLRRVYY